MATFKVGDRVWWTDPDRDLASGSGVIVRIQHDPPVADSVIALKMDSGSECECLRHELRHLEPSKAPSSGKRYNHAYSFGFTVLSNSKEADDVTGAQLRKAIIEGLAKRTDKEVLDNCDCPFDTYEEEQ